MSCSPSEILAAVAELRAKGLCPGSIGMSIEEKRGVLAAAELGARALESLAKHDIDVLSYAPENRQPDDGFSSEALVALDVFDAAMELGFLRMPAARPEAPPAMTLTRDELIEKARAFLQLERGVFLRSEGRIVDACAEFCLPLLAAARERTIEECARACDGIVYDIDGTADRQIETRKRCQKRIRALHAPSEKQRERSPDGGVAREKAPQEDDSGEALAIRGEPPTNPRSTRGAPTQLSNEDDADEDAIAEMCKPSPHLTDAEILDLAAKTLIRHGWKDHHVEQIRRMADDLRARAAPKPDLADAVARDAWSRMHTKETLAALLRERFGPCVEALKKIEEMEHRSHDAALGTIHYLARTALARLRGEEGKP